MWSFLEFYDLNWHDGCLGLGIGIVEGFLFRMDGIWVWIGRIWGWRIRIFFGLVFRFYWFICMEVVLG